MSGDDRDRLRDLAKDLPWDKPDAERREALRSSLLVAAAESKAMPRRRWLVAGGAFAAGVLAAAAIALVVTRPAEPAAKPGSPSATPTALNAPMAPVQGEPTGYAQIDASSAAELERTRVASATGIDETVRIRAGRVRLVVPPVRAGDRVRTKTADAEVEGTGAFEIVVVADALDRVTVTSGTAAIRIASESQPVFLSAGESWNAKAITASVDLTPSVEPKPAPTTKAPRTRPVVEAHVSESPTIAAPSNIAAPSAPTTPPPVPAPSIAAAPSTTAPPGPLAKGRTETERHFQAGLALERAGKHAEAAIELGLAADAGTDELAVDARYFQAVSLVKASMSAAAERALVEFLDHAPRSVRRGRAAVMLARLYAERGDTLAARQWYESAKDDPDAAVATAARQGLDALR